jgi:hypothetical protein
VSQVSALRRTFAADRNLIRTIAQARLPIHRCDPHGLGMARCAGNCGNARSDAHAIAPGHEPAGAVSELIGRDAELDPILGLSASHSFVTLAGAGAIGKTRLGFEVARRLLPRFADCPLTTPLPSSSPRS